MSAPAQIESLPLPTLLSFAWVAFTIEVDNAFEERMPHLTTRSGGSGNGPWLVSHAMWWTCMRFVDEHGISVGELERLAHTKTNLNGMIRWGYVAAAAGSDRRRATPLGKDVTLRATRKGLAAREVWRPLTHEVEARWRQRIGDDAFTELGLSLEGLLAGLDRGLPDWMPILGYGLRCPDPIATSELRPDTANLSLPVMLARALLSFTFEYEREAGLSLAIAANVLRLVDQQSCRLRDLPAASGVSAEAIAMAVGFLERRNLANVLSEGRTRVMTLTPSGLAARADYRRLVPKIEAQWRSRFGDDAPRRVRYALENAVTGESGRALLAEATTAPPTGWRASAKTPTVLPWQPMVLHRGGFPDGS